MRLNRQPPVHLFSKQRPHLGGFTLQENGGEQWTCPTGLATRAGFQPDAALRGFTLQSGGGERSCSPAPTCRGPIRFKRVPEEFAPRIPDRESAQRILKWSPHEDLHLDLELRGLASCLLDDEGRNWSPPPGSHRPGPTYKVGTSLATSDGHWLPRRVTLPVLALI